MSLSRHCRLAQGTHAGAVLTLVPDWVCEIVPLGHERKDTLQPVTATPPASWLVWYRLVDDGYRIIETFAGRTHARIPPFEAVELDLAFLLGTA